jgi:hypothetical protein
LETGAQESRVYLAIKFKSASRCRFPELGGGGFVATIPIFDAGDCGGAAPSRNQKTSKLCRNLLQKSERNAKFTSRRRSAWRLGLAKEGGVLEIGEGHEGRKIFLFESPVIFEKSRFRK